MELYPKFKMIMKCMGISIENHLLKCSGLPGKQCLKLPAGAENTPTSAFVFLHGLSTNGPHDSQQFSPPKSSGYTMPPCCARSNPILRVMFLTIIIQINIQKTTTCFWNCIWMCAYMIIYIYTYIHSSSPYVVLL